MASITNNSKMSMFNKSRAPRGNYKFAWEIEKERVAAEAAAKRASTEKAILEKTENNFPSLGGASKAAPSWSGRKFSELAADWKRDDDDRKAEEDRKKNSKHVDDNFFILPKFNNVRRFVEEDEYDEEEYYGETHETSIQEPVENDETGWTSVSNRKVRKQKVLPSINDENFMRDPDEDEKPKDDSVWNGPLEHETYWDERK